MALQSRLMPLLASRIPEAAAVLLLAVVAVVIWLGAQYRAQVGWIEHTLEVRTELELLRSAFQNAEIGQRSYLLTGDEEFLELWRSAPEEIESRLDSVEEMTRDNPKQQQALTELRSLIAHRLDLAEARIAQRRSGDFQGAVREVATRRGLNAYQDVERHILNMEEDEQRLLAARQADNARTVRLLAAAALFGLLITVAALFRWIRQTRRDARELAQAHGMLLASVGERGAAEAQLRQAQKMEAVGQLTGGIAHDFNNMLAVILGSLNLIQKRLREGNSDIGRFVDASAEAATRAANLTTRLLAFSRQQPLSPEPVSANRLVGGMAEILQRTLGEEIRIETIMGAGVWLTHTDPGQLENAILNICVNARDAMPEGGKLTIETANAHIDDAYARENEVPAGQYVLIAITDSGEGMPPDVLARAFDPFFTTKEIGKGSGLGLSQVYGFVRQSGGHAKIYSESGVGTTIKLYLPRFFPKQDEVAALQSADGEVRPLAPGDPHQIILVVEDEERVRELTVASLRELGYTVVHANGAAKALRQLDAHPDVALLFTDIVMPEMNGRKLAEEALRRKPDIKVLYTTGFTRNAVVHNGVLDAGVQFVAKPYTIEQLATKVREVLDGR